MTVEELKEIGKNKVRLTPDLMTSYIILFKEKFGRSPDCAGCTFNKDWEKLINAEIKKTEIMSEKTFKLKKVDIVYSYDFYDKKLNRKIRKRAYANVMTEEFADEYLTFGSVQEIEERKKQFSILPKKFIISEDINFDKLTAPKLKELASEKEYPKEEWEKLKKDELIVYLNLKEIEKE